MDLNPFVWTKTFCGRLSLVLTTEKDAISHQKIALQINVDMEKVTNTILIKINTTKLTLIWKKLQILYL